MDNHHVTISNSSASCGVIELSGITSDYQKVLFALANYLYHPARGQPAAFVMWSDVPESNGEVLLDYIGGQFGLLNTTIESSLVVNPKTGNLIFVVIWTIPHEEFKKWYIEQRVERAKKL